MSPIEFKQMNATLAKDQPQYQPLPVYRADEPEGRIISCWKFSIKERLRILFGANLWWSQMTFGKPLQPQLPQLESPFK
jgi:hypothetical protein